MPAVSASLHVARQPILDARRDVYGYELLHRADATATVCDGNLNHACALVIEGALAGVGVDGICDGRRAFINVSEEMLRSDSLGLLPPDQVVLEVLETIEATPEIVARCQQLVDQGYVLALDDFVAGTSAEALVPSATFVKVDVLSTPPEAVTALAARLLPRGIALVAEKVETPAAFDAARDAGCALFQGYHFCRPQTISSRTLSASEVSQLQLLAALLKPTVTMAEIETLLKREAALSLRVLRSVNSAALGLRREIHSIREALVLLGLDQLRKWAALWMLTGLNQGCPEVLTMTVVRARACETLGEALRRDPGGDFLLGLCSLLDALLAQPMPAAIAGLPLPDDTRAALLGRANDAGRLLSTVVAYERGHWRDANDQAVELGADPGILPMIYLDALAWARRTTRAGLTA